MSDTTDIAPYIERPPVHLAVYVHAFLTFLFHRFANDASERFVPKPRIVLVLTRLQRLIAAFIEAARTPIPPRPEPRPRPEAAAGAQPAEAAARPDPAAEPPLDPFLPRSSKPHRGLPTSFGWLCEIAPFTGVCKTMLSELINGADMRAYLDADWRLWPILRPICRMLGVSPLLLPALEPHLRWPPRKRPGQVGDKKLAGDKQPAGEAPKDEESADAESPNEAAEARDPPAIHLPDETSARLAKAVADAAAEARANAEAVARASVAPPMPPGAAPPDGDPPRPIDWNARDLLTEVKNWGRKKRW
ncbi:MAG: hypothetical protein KGI51_01100 [Rhodospirillales bacterium]|nr:hypothetical protein [Rhodospirillales bacterium]